MKTIEQQKAEILDDFMEYWNTMLQDTDVTPHLTIRMTVDKYNALTVQPTESTNPFIDEIFDMRICNVISDILNKEVKNIRLSDCPHISKLDKRKNIGFGSIQAYEVAMRKYGLNDKLI